MKLEEVIVLVIKKLEDFSIDYMITGSFASNLHGVPRTTFDADIVISANLKQLEEFANDIKDDFYIELQAIKKALETKGMFNIIHYHTGFKIDFIIRKDDPYYIEEFERRKRYKLAGMDCFFASAEDTILAKLLWAKAGESERQFIDALNIAKIQKGSLNYNYLENWSKALSVYDLFEKIIKEIK